MVCERDEVQRRVQLGVVAGLQFNFLTFSKAVGCIRAEAVASCVGVSGPARVHVQIAEQCGF